VTLQAFHFGASVAVALALTACGGPTAATTVTETVTLSTIPGEAQGPTGFVATEREVRRWKAAWCDVELGTKPDDAIRLMGTPTYRTDAVLEWSAYEWTFQALVDTREGLYNLQWDDETDVERVGCPEYRVAG
jgi:hypothetical protein